jgi:hypothetical protein
LYSSKIKIKAVDEECLTGTERNEVQKQRCSFREETRVQNLTIDWEEKRL